MIHYIFNVVRTLNGVKKQLSRGEAIMIAKEECKRQGLTWTEPILVKEHSLQFDIKTNAECIGGNAYISVSIKDGKVLRFGFSRR